MAQFTLRRHQNAPKVKAWRISLRHDAFPNGALMAHRGATGASAAHRGAYIRACQKITDLTDHTDLDIDQQRYRLNPNARGIGQARPLVRWRATPLPGG
jgi:hypothetical protein